MFVFLILFSYIFQLRDRVSTIGYILEIFANYNQKKIEGEQLSVCLRNTSHEIKKN